MIDKDTIMLKRAIRDYLQWMRAMENKNSKARMRYGLVLIDFIDFVKENNIVWADMFTLDTLKAFRKYTNHNNSSDAIRGLSLYLFDNERIPQPLRRPDYQVDLPEIYEHYLSYHEQSRQVPYSQIKRIRRVLASFSVFLEKLNIELADIRIEHIEAFMAEFHQRFAPGTCKTYRFHLRGFLKYLYQERKILSKDLVPLVVGAPLFAQAQPPKFLRPQELQQFFSNLRLTTPTHIRTYAMVHLAYYMGLRPQEISKIKLKDISFKKKGLTLRERKGNNPTILPVPENTIKALTAYVSIARPNKSKYRNLFLSFHRPYRSISPTTVVQYISKAIKHSGLLSSPYSLRHTYAQNLLNAGATIYEIKEMLGHQNIQSTQRYLHIDIERMRKVLFDEEL
jgi:site-specific recombinase XerD